MVLLVGSAVLIGNFEFMPPAATTAAFYECGRFMAGGCLGILTSFFLLWFAGSVRDALRVAGEDRLGAIALGGGVFAAVMMSVGHLAQAAGAERAMIHGTIGADAAATLFDLSSLSVGTGAAIGLAALVFATVAALRFRSEETKIYYG